MQPGNSITNGAGSPMMNPMASPQVLPSLYGQSKDTAVLKNGLEIAMKQNMMKNSNMFALQNNANSGDNFNMIFDMISGMMNDKSNNNEQRMVFLFQQLYSLENLLTTTRNELLKLESSLRDGDDDKKSKKNIAEMKYEEATGHEGGYAGEKKAEETYHLGYDLVTKKRHIN